MPGLSYNNEKGGFIQIGGSAYLRSGFCAICASRSVGRNRNLGNLYETGGRKELFEEVGQTLSRTGQGLAQKARDTAQVTKLKLAVSEDERAIEGIYLSIGKAYCRMCEACSPEQLPSEAASEPIASLLTSLRERKQQLLDKQQTIRVIQQVMVCPKCGASCSAEGSFCTNCGASLQEAKAGVFSCPACGSKLKPGAAFCTQCGKPVR